MIHAYAKGGDKGIVEAEGSRVDLVAEYAAITGVLFENFVAQMSAEEAFYWLMAGFQTGIENLQEE